MKVLRLMTVFGRPRIPALSYSATLTAHDLSVPQELGVRGNWIVTKPNTALILSLSEFAKICLYSHGKVAFWLGDGMERTLGRRRGVDNPTNEQVEEQLSRILASGELQLPRRTTAFLEFVVKETVAGRGDYLKGFTIARQVFGRDVSFDPQNDPCVRIEAARVRRGLERYYLVCGSEDPVEITIPKGGYRPVFKLRTNLVDITKVRKSAKVLREPEVDPHRRWPRSFVESSSRADRRKRNIAFLTAALCSAPMLGLTLLFLGSNASRDREGPHVDTDVVIGGFSTQASVGRDIADQRPGAVLRDEMIAGLVSQRELNVLLKEPKTENLRGRRYIVDADGMIRMSARLVRASDGVLVWAGSADHASQSLRKAAEESATGFVSEISRALAHEP